MGNIPREYSLEFVSSNFIFLTVGNKIGMNLKIKNLKIKMSNLQTEITSTYTVRISLPFNLSPVFSSLDSNKQQLRVRVYHSLLSAFDNPATKWIRPVPSVHVDGYTYTLLLSQLHNPQRYQQPSEPPLLVSLKEEQSSYEVGPFQVRLIFEKSTPQLALKLTRTHLMFDCCKLEKIKIVQNQLLEGQLRKAKMRSMGVESGVLSMDSRQRLLVDGWKTALPAVGLWVRGQVGLASVQVYQNVVRYAKEQFKVKCSFDEEQVSFILLLLHQDTPEAHLLTLTQCYQTEEVKVNDCSEEIIDFHSDVEASGMEFTLRDRTNLDFYSPIKSLETEKLEQQLSKIDQRHNSPEFTRVDIREDLGRKVEEQEREIANLKEEIALLKKQLQRSLQSGDKKSLIRSPQYEHWSSRAITPERLQESDLKIGLSSKGSTNNTKSSDRFDEMSEFRRARQVIMEADEPWDRVELIE